MVVVEFAFSFIWKSVETPHELLEVWGSAMVSWNVTLWELRLNLTRCLHGSYDYPDRIDDNMNLKK